MASLVEAFRRLFGTSGTPLTREAGEPKAVAGGLSAVRALEARICEAVSIQQSWLAAAHAYFGPHSPDTGARAAELYSPDARAALATASGLALSGLRASALVDASEPSAIVELVTRAVQRHLPLVIHVRLLESFGGGHELWHQLADCGATLLLATSVQDSVDLTLIAHRLGEATLVPVVVGQDGVETATSLQDVLLPSRKLATSYLRGPADLIACPSAAQLDLFGAHRRRVPRWHDLDRPALIGADMWSAERSLMTAGQRPYFASHVEEQWGLSATALETLGGGAMSPLVEHRLDDAEVVLLCQGASVEVARAVSDQLRGRRGPRVGVVGLRRLRPFPAIELAHLLYGKQTVAVLERLDSPAALDTPLTRELRAALDFALSGASQERPHATRFDARSHPRVVSAIYGLGGAPLLLADLADYAEQLRPAPQAVTYLGTNFWLAAGSYPKRQTRLESLQKAYPQTRNLGLVGAPQQDGASESFTFAVYRAGNSTSELAAAAAALLEQVSGGGIRSRLATNRAPWGQVVRDTVLHAQTAPFDPGALPTSELAIVTRDAAPSLARTESWLNELATQAVILLELRDSSAMNEFERNIVALASARGHQVFASVAGGSDTEDVRRERLLGALFAVLDRERQLGTSLLRLTRAHPEPGPDQHSELAAFRAGFEGVVPIEGEGTPNLAASADDGTVPEFVRRAARAQGGHPPPAFSLPEFFNQYGVLYRDEKRHELVADPRLTAGIVPSLSAALSRPRRHDPPLVALNAAACTGCGRCWTFCPDSAIGAVAIRPTALLESGMRISKQRGEDSEALQPLLGKLGSAIHADLERQQSRPTSVSELTAAPFDKLLQKLPHERQEPARRAFGAALSSVGKLPVVRTEALYDEVERKTPGQGELLSLVLNPDACKGCGACVSLCEPEALSLCARDATRALEATEQWRSWEMLPDTSGATLARLRDHPDLGDLPALFLSRHCLLTLSGGDAAEAGSGAKMALHATLASIEYRMQQHFLSALAELEELRSRVAARIRDTLGAAVPSDDLGSLSQGLVGLSEDSTRFSDLVARLEQIVGQGHVDVNELRELVDAGQRLSDLTWHLSGGETGFGRARSSIVLCKGPEPFDLVAFPHNSFVAPVVAEFSDAPDIARGLMQGNIEQTLRAVRDLRRARLLLDSPQKARLMASSLEQLRFEELSEAERRLCPPVLLVGAAARFDDRELLALLGGQQPFRVLLLAEVGTELDRGKRRERDPLELLALAGGAFVAQASLGHLKHLGRCLLSLASHDGPALVQVHAPSPKEQGFASDGAVRQSELALLARAHPLFSYDPALPGVFGKRLSISDNPGTDRTWVVDEAGRSLTPADFWRTEARCQHHFEPLPDDAKTTLPIADYLELPRPERSAKTPYVLTETGQKLVPSPALIAAAERRLRTWRVLQELSGTVTPFAEHVRAEVERADSSTHERDLNELRQQFERRLDGVLEDQRDQLVTTVRDRLLALAGFSGNGNAPRRSP